MICADGLSVIKEAIAAAYPPAEYQRCIVHMVRNTLKYVADKDKPKRFYSVLPEVLHAAQLKFFRQKTIDPHTDIRQKFPLVPKTRTCKLLVKEAISRLLRPANLNVSDA